VSEHEADTAPFQGAGQRREPTRPIRNSFGRRRSDFDETTLITKKMIVVIIVIIDALYLIGEALLVQAGIC
jgi:hypothetical protein